MRGLTLTQPWATLVAIGAKKIETRGWNTSYRGPLAIHAAKGYPAGCRRLTFEFPFSTFLRPAGYFTATMPTSCVVAVCDLVDAFQFTPGFDPGGPENAFGNYTPGRWGFKLANVRRLKDPVVCAGALGVWKFKDEATRAAVLERAEVRS